MLFKPASKSSFLLLIFCFLDLVDVGYILSLLCWQAGEDRPGSSSVPSQACRGFVRRELDSQIIEEESDLSSGGLTDEDIWERRVLTQSSS